MRKPLATLAASVAFILTAAVPSHAGTPVSVVDPAGDATADVESSPVSAEGLAAADLLGLDVRPAKKSVTLTWTVANVDLNVDASSGEGWTTTYNAMFGWKAKGKKNGVAISASNFSNRVEMFGDVTKSTCKGAKVSRTSTTVTARVPYTCVPGWKSGTKIAVVQGRTYASAPEQGLYSDDTDIIKGVVLK